MNAEVKTPSLAEVRAAAELLAQANRRLVLTASAQQAEIGRAIAPILARFRPEIDAAAEEKSRLFERLFDMVQRWPNLFKRPRSVKVDGVSTGYRKAADSLDWDDEKVIIDRLRNLMPDKAHLFIRTEEHLVIDAISNLDHKFLQQLGIRRINGADNAFITIGDSDVDKLAKAIVEDASRRIAEEENTKPKSGKVKLKEPATP